MNFFLQLFSCVPRANRVGADEPVRKTFLTIGVISIVMRLKYLRKLFENQKSRFFDIGKLENPLFDHFLSEFTNTEPYPKHGVDLTRKIDLRQNS
jgi:hypothetical protein